MARSGFPLQLALSFVVGTSCSLLAPRDADLIGGPPAAGAGASGAPVIDSAGSDGEARPDAGAPPSGGAPGSAGMSGAPGVGGGAGLPELPEIPRDSLLVWLAGDRGVHLVDGAIDRWADQSGNGMDAIKSIANERPRPTPALPDLPNAVLFDGVDDSLSFGEGFSNFAAGLTLFAIANQSKNADCSSIIQLSNGAEVDDVDFGRQTESLSYEVQNNEVNGVPGAFTLGQMALLGVVHRPDLTVDLRLNGEFTKGDLDFQLPAALSRRKNFIGRSLYSGCPHFTGKIGEILLYSRALSEEEVTRVETYLGQKWRCCGAE